MPEIIEIVPPSLPVRALINVPGSKSVTNRVLVLAALREGQTQIQGALWSEDTQVMTQCLDQLGYDVQVLAGQAEVSNRTINISGKRAVPPGGTLEHPLDLFVGNAGTAARFLCAMLCLGSGVYRLSGVPRMRERPQGELFSALRQLGYSIVSDSSRLPALVHGGGPKRAKCLVSISESSQFASALLLSAEAGGWTIEVAGSNADEAPYVTMTRELIKAYASARGKFEVEPDASSASYFIAANHLLSATRHQPAEIHLGRVPSTTWQVDARFNRFLPLPAKVSRANDLGDSILTAMIIAPFEEHPVRFVDLGRLRVQECERVAAMRTELARCGADVREDGDTLQIRPSTSNLHGAEVETYGDHRIAMTFAILGLVVPGMKIRNPACVKKTFPDFFQKLALPPPEGLGALIRHGRTGQPLQIAELFAD